MEAVEHTEYTTVTGYFLQDDPVTGLNDLNLMGNFGLIDREYDADAEYDPERRKLQWERFANQVGRLNAESDARTSYRVLFLARHGEGYHNVAEAYYGTEAWDCYWSLLEGNDTMTWADSRLTPTGRAQAQDLSKAWSSQINTQGLPPPETYYTSPLTRCLETSHLAFAPLHDTPGGVAIPPFRPIIKELFRETIGVHTCDRRSRRSEIDSVWRDKGYVFEAGFVEEDPLWTPDERETDAGEDERSRRALGKVFADTANTWISITSHSGLIASLLRVLHHHPFALPTGGMLPVLVRAQLAPGPGPTLPGGRAWARPPVCLRNGV